MELLWFKGLDPLQLNMRGCFFLKEEEEEETATIPHAKLRFTYRQMEISDTCILWGLARLHTLRGIRV